MSRRLHLIPNVYDMRGLFEIIKCTKSEIIIGESIDAQFPRYEQVIPAIETGTGTAIKLFRTTKESGASRSFYESANAGVLLNYLYVYEALDCEALEILARVIGPREPVRIDIEDRRAVAVIMPMERK